MRAKINWGIPVYFFLFIVMSFNIIFIYYLIVYLHSIILIFFIPVFILDIILVPVFKSIIMRLINKDNYDFLISNKCIEINKKLHNWDSIRSISFETGRLASDNTFFQGFKLPALQKIYLLDKEGKEYSATIDIDYFLKGNRDKNNLVLAKNYLFDLGKIALLSDWAQKR